MHRAVHREGSSKVALYVNIQIQLESYMRIGSMWVGMERFNTNAIDAMNRCNIFTFIFILMHRNIQSTDSLRHISIISS